MHTPTRPVALAYPSAAKISPCAQHAQRAQRAQHSQRAGGCLTQLGAALLLPRRRAEPRGAKRKAPRAPARPAAPPAAAAPAHPAPPRPPAQSAAPRLLVAAEDVLHGVAARQSLVDLHGGAAGVGKQGLHALALQRLDQDVAAAGRTGAAGRGAA